MPRSSSGFARSSMKLLMEKASRQVRMTSRVEYSMPAMTASASPRLTKSQADARSEAGRASRGGREVSILERA